MSDDGRDYDPEWWSLTECRSDLCLWVHRREKTEMVVIRQPSGVDHWEIMDTTGEAVEGASLGPYKSLTAAVERVQEDLPGVQL